jgi:hypothetical protein
MYRQLLAAAIAFSANSVYAQPVKGPETVKAAGGRSITLS